MAKERTSPEPSAVDSEPLKNSWLALSLAWIMPGFGHLYLERRGRAIIYLGLVMTALAVGCWLDGNLYRPTAGQPLTSLATLACMGMGAPYFVLRFALGYEGVVTSPGYEYGAAFILTAGLMNLLLVLDAWDIARGRKE